MNRTGICIALVAGLGAGAAAQTIETYDIDDAALTGFGGWSHVYNGSITNTGSGSANGFGFDRGDYSGGGGTLNDGFEGSSAQDTQLFANNESARPVITLNLDNQYFIEDLTLFSFDSGNSIPGRIRGFDVTINGVTESFLSSEPTANDEFVDLEGSSLDGLGTDTIVLSNFLHDGGNSLDEMFAIGEIEVNGTLVPAPGAMALLGLGGLAATRRRR